MLLSATLLVMFLTPLMLLEVSGYVTHGPTITHVWPEAWASRCDHLIEMNTGPEDTWTGTGIRAFYDQETVTPASFVGANWYFERGYGGGGTAYHRYISDGPMGCAYQYGNPPYSCYIFLHHDYDTPQWGNGEWDLYWAYYQDWPKENNPFSPYPYRHNTLGGIAQSYFKDPLK